MFALQRTLHQAFVMDTVPRVYQHVCGYQSSSTSVYGSRFPLHCDLESGGLRSPLQVINVEEDGTGLANSGASALVDQLKK